MTFEECMRHAERYAKDARNTSNMDARQANATLALAYATMAINIRNQAGVQRVQVVNNG